MMGTKLILIPLMFLLVISFTGAISSVQWNITFDDAEDLFGNTCTVSGGTLQCGNSETAAVVHKALNISTNTANHTFELRAKFGSTGTNHYSWFFNAQNDSSILANEWNWDVVGGSLKIRGVTDFDTTALPDNTWHLFKFVTLMNQSVDFYLNNSYVGNVGFKYNTSNSSWWLFKTDTDAIFEVDWIAHYNTSETNVTVPLTPAAPTFSGNIRNVSVPLENDHVGFSINVTSSDNVTGYVFSTDNGTSGRWFNSSFMDLPNYLKIANVTYNITIYNSSGVIYQWRFWANDTDGDWGVSSTYSLIVGGTNAPNVTIHSSNFFNTEDSAVINLDQSKIARLNFSLTDDIAVYGFELVILDPNGTISYNWTNSSMNGVVANFTKVVNVTSFSAVDGVYIVNITAWDSHTVSLIPSYDVVKGDDYLLFDNNIRITGEKAVGASTTKKSDRYNFQFQYSSFFTPSKKKYILESDYEITYIPGSDIVGHFVIWDLKKWVDFEGLPAKPKVTKISDFKYEIEFDNADEKVVFSSIGGLNPETYLYEFYLVNPYLDWLIPTTTTEFFINQSITVSLNVTSDYRNETRFRLYNSTNGLVDSFNISNDGTGTYFYNATFTGLTGTTYYVNATHWNLLNSSTNSTTLTFSNAVLNLTFYDEVLDELILWDIITLDIVGEDFAQNYSTNTSKIGVYGWTKGDYRLTYDSNKYGKRSYYYTLGSATNYSIDLYLLSTTNATDVTFTAQDASGNELSNATIYLKRYYVATNSYRTVAMERTNEEGEVIIDVDFNDAFYQLLVTYGDYSLQTIGTRIITTTMFLTIDLIGDPFEHIDIIDDITTSLTFNNITQTFSFTFLDTTGTNRKGLLEVRRITPTENVLLCNTTDISSSATLLCQVNTTNPVGTYLAKGFIMIGSYDLSILREMLEIATGIAIDLKNVWGPSGEFFAILITGFLTSLGAVTGGPALAVVMFMVGLIISKFLGLIIFSAAMVGFIILMGVMIIYRIKK